MIHLQQSPRSHLLGRHNLGSTIRNLTPVTNPRIVQTNVQSQVYNSTQNLRPGL